MMLQKAVILGRQVVVGHSAIRGLSQICVIKGSQAPALNNIVATQQEFASTPNSTFDVLNQLSRLNLSDHKGHCLSNNTVKKEYQLPSVISNHIVKISILDPCITPKSYELPTNLSLVFEKVTPTLQSETPKVDPSLHPGLPVIEKRAAWLVRVRHKKMKKHKLKKLRKRMIFLNRKLTLIKNKKKEAILQAREKGYANSAKEFNAEKYVEEQIALGKKGKWQLNIFETRGSH